MLITDNLKLEVKIIELIVEIVTFYASVLCLRVCDRRMVRNISRGEEGRVLPEDLHRILGETC